MFTFEHFAGSAVTSPRAQGRARKGELLPDMPVVLVVENEALLQPVLHDALKDGGFDVVMTASGEQALTLLKSGVVKYSAIATDVNLDGEATGWEVAKQARENDPQVAVVYMTGASADQWPSQGVPGSILLQKPFAPAQLLTAVSQLLNATPPAT